MGKFYFWRTKAGAEVDIIIESNGNITAIECKWTKSDSKHIKTFLKAYPKAEALVINKNNYLDQLV